MLQLWLKIKFAHWPFVSLELEVNQLQCCVNQSQATLWTKKNNLLEDDVQYHKTQTSSFTYEVDFIRKLKVLALFQVGKVQLHDKLIFQPVKYNELTLSLVEDFQKV